jgi:hypothetical protein
LDQARLGAAIDPFLNNAQGARFKRSRRGGKEIEKSNLFLP